MKPHLPLFFIILVHLKDNCVKNTNVNAQMAKASGDLDNNAIKELMQQLKSENEELRRRLNTMENLSEENSKLRRLKEELEMCLNTAREEISHLSNDKRILQETIRDLRIRIPDRDLRASSRGSLWSNKR